MRGRCEKRGSSEAGLIVERSNAMQAHQGEMVFLGIRPEQLGVSRMVIRESLRMLPALGLVNVQHSVGW